MADQPFTLENHIEGPVYMDEPTAPAGPVPFIPSEHDQFPPTAPDPASSHGFLSGIGPAVTEALHNTNFADMARQATDGMLHMIPAVSEAFKVEAADHAAEAGVDDVLIIPDDGYDYVDAEVMVADAGDDQAHEAQAVASHNDHDGGYDA